MTRCLVCRKPCGPKAVLLYHTPAGEQWCHAGRCLREYNGEAHIPLDSAD